MLTAEEDKKVATKDEQLAREAEMVGYVHYSEEETRVIREREMAYIRDMTRLGVYKK